MWAAALGVNMWSGLVDEGVWVCGHGRSVDSGEC